MNARVNESLNNWRVCIGEFINAVDLTSGFLFVISVHPPFSFNTNLQLLVFKQSVRVLFSQKYSG